MSKEYLEAFKKIAEIYGNTNSQEGTYEYFLTIKRALVRLEAIDNANPSEALECLDSMYARLPQWDLCRNLDQYNTIKQALLKTQDPKQYLKWSDLAFSKENTYIKATLNSAMVTLKCWKEGRKELCVVDFNNAPCNNMMFVHHGYDDDTDTQSNLFDALGFVRI